MLTLRFMNGVTIDETVVSAARYDVRHQQSNDKMCAVAAIVTIYPQTTSESGGVEFHIGGEHPLAYGVCWVENQSGKTIGRIGSFEPESL